MSSNEEDYSEEDEDYVPEENLASDDDDQLTEEKVDEECSDKSSSKENAVHKEKVDKLWQNFKEDVKKQTAPHNKPEYEENLNNKNTNDDEAVQVKSNANTRESGNKVGAVVDNDKDTVTITKVYDFAGEDVKVTKEVKRDSVEAQNHFKEQTSFQPTKGLLGRTSGALKKRPGSGIGSVLGKLGKKPKLSTLEKSKLDWNQYKEDEGIEEELQSYNKGKQGYLEKVSFLERTEMRQFEKERDVRLSKSGRR